jgi:hypothetical protein
MKPEHKLLLWLAVIISVTLMEIQCGSNAVKAQQEKTKQLQIIQSMQMYQLDSDLPFQEKNFNDPKNIRKS